MHCPIYISIYSNTATSSSRNKDTVNGDAEQILSSFVIFPKDRKKSWMEKFSLLLIHSNLILQFNFISVFKKNTTSVDVLKNYRVIKPIN